MALQAYPVMILQGRREPIHGGLRAASLLRDTLQNHHRIRRLSGCRIFLVNLSSRPPSRDTVEKGIIPNSDQRGIILRHYVWVSYKPSHTTSLLASDQRKDYSLPSSTGCSTELRGETFANPMNLIQLILA